MWGSLAILLGLGPGDPGSNPGIPSFLSLMKKVQGIIYVLLAIPTVVHAMIQSVSLIHAPIVLENFDHYILQTFGGYIIYFSLLITMMLGLATLITLGIYIGVTPLSEKILSAGNTLLASTAIFTLFVVWFIARASDPTAPFEFSTVAISWVVALGISLIVAAFRAVTD